MCGFFGTIQIEKVCQERYTLYQKQLTNFESVYTDYYDFMNKKKYYDDDLTIYIN